MWKNDQKSVLGNFPHFEIKKLLKKSQYSKTVANVTLLQNFQKI